MQKLNKYFIFGIIYILYVLYYNYKATIVFHKCEECGNSNIHIINYHSFNNKDINKIFNLFETESIWLITVMSKVQR